jgi:hypothetical protein
LKKAGCEDRDQESDRIEGFINALLPLLAPSNVLRILEDGKLLSRLRLHFAAEALTKLTQAPVLVFIVEADVADESCWKLTHRANLTGGIIRTARLRDKLAAVRFLSFAWLRFGYLLRNSDDDLYSSAKLGGFTRVVSPHINPSVEIVPCSLGIGAHNVGVLSKKRITSGSQVVIVPMAAAAEMLPLGSKLLWITLHCVV